MRYCTLPVSQTGDIFSAFLQHLLKNYLLYGAVRSAASSNAAMRMVAGSRPVLVIA